MLVTLAPTSTRASAPAAEAELVDDGEDAKHGEGGEVDAVGVSPAASDRVR